MKYLMFYETAPDGLEKARIHFPAHRARLGASSMPAARC